MTRQARTTRRAMLKSTAIAAPTCLFGAYQWAAQRSGPARDLSGMNVVLFITDQERAIQHFPPGWAQKNLPGKTRLQRNGITFVNAFCNACMCSPSRATLMTGYFPAQHGVKYTLEEDMPNNQYPQVELPLDLKNIASVMSAAGYQVVYKGKWHLNKPAGATWVPEDVGKYGFERWNPPDAGADQSLDQAGGGNANNDHRFIFDVGNVATGEEGALSFLKSRTIQSPPFFLIVSLVNPHDVLFYPKTYIDGGYDDSWLQGDIGLPQTVAEDLSTKPDAQQAFLKIFNLNGPLVTDQMKRNYLNFYGNVMKSSDAYLVDVLNTLQAGNLLDNTLVVCTADHGEMGVAHGGLRQKCFNFYEESLRVPFIYSNPVLYPTPQTSTAMISHVDFLPTIANLFKAPNSARAAWQGVDYSGLINNSSATPPQPYIVFTYDDWQAGQSTGPYVPPPNHVVSIRETRFKLAEYFDVNGNEPSQWEMYDLLNDPLEQNNLAFGLDLRPQEVQQQFQRLSRELEMVQSTRLKPLG